MNKNQILKELKESKLDKNEIIIISGASLVMRDIVKQTKDIDIACTIEYYNKLNWKEKKGFFGINIKYNKNIEISYNLYDPENIDIIDEYKTMNLDACLNLKQKNKQKKRSKYYKNTN